MLYMYSNEKHCESKIKENKISIWDLQRKKALILFIC